MVANIIAFVLRIGLIAVIWVLIWKNIKPRTQLARIMRAAVLVLVLLGIWATLKFTGGQ